MCHISQVDLMLLLCCSLKMHFILSPLSNHCHLSGSEIVKLWGVFCFFFFLQASLNYCPWKASLPFSSYAFWWADKFHKRNWQMYFAADHVIQIKWLPCALSSPLNHWKGFHGNTSFNPRHACATAKSYFCSLRNSWHQQRYPLWLSVHKSYESQ